MGFNLTPRDVADFEEKHPAAAAFIRARSLFNEYRHLETNYIILNKWEKNRLKELEQLPDCTPTEIARANVRDMFFENSESLQG